MLGSDPSDDRLYGWRLRDVMHVNKFPPFVLSVRVVKCEALHRLSTLHECYLVPHGGRVLVPCGLYVLGLCYFSF